MRARSQVGYRIHVVGSQVLGIVVVDLLHGMAIDCNIGDAEICALLADPGYSGAGKAALDRSAQARSSDTGQIAIEQTTGVARGGDTGSATAGRKDNRGVCGADHSTTRWSGRRL